MSAPSRRTNTPSGSSGYASLSEMDRYQLVSNIGKGSFGVISKVKRKEDGKEFALKQLDYGKMNDRDRRQILAEVAILESLKHRNIVQLVQKIRDEKNEHIFIVMEYCPSGDLGSLIRKAQRGGQPLHEDKVWNIFLQITLALHHCHWPKERRASPRMNSQADIGRTQVLHRDLKPENVFLSGDIVKLGDFGLSKDMAGHAFTSTYVGTPLYMPPEILTENRYDTKSDIWSLGCLVYEMCALTSPFSNAKTHEELLSMVKSGRLPPLPGHFSPALKTVIKAMLNLNPVRRPSTKDLLEMDEMKMHRKLFTIQSQTAILSQRKDELLAFEARLRAREAEVESRSRTLGELDARFQALADREAAVSERESSLTHREAEMDAHEEILKENYRRFENNNEMLKQRWAALRESELARGKEDQERDSSQQGRNGDAAQAQPQQVVQTAAAPPEERRPTSVSSTSSRHPSYDTPSKIPFPSAYSSPAPLDSRLNSRLNAVATRKTAGLPKRLASKSLTNLSARAREDEVTSLPQRVVTPKKGSPSSPNRHVAGRTSIGSPSELDRVFGDDVSMRTATSFGSPAPGMLPTPYLARPRKASTAADDDVAAFRRTQIPAPVSFVYRPDATPAKWTPEDPDLPSPFLKRVAQPVFGSTPGNSASSSASSTGSSSGSGTASANTPGAPAPADRAPLSSINPQPAQPFAQPVRRLPRSKSGNLHHAVLARNAARSGDSAGALGGPVRTRVGRDPARC